MKLKVLVYFIFIMLFTFLTTGLTTAMHAQTFSVIHSFTGGAGGLGPIAGVTIRGNVLYGTTANVWGGVYQLGHSGSDWRFSTIAVLLYQAPLDRVVFGPDGHLYAAADSSGPGMVLRLTPPVGICRTVACYWNVTDLHDFGSGTDGVSPKYGDLVFDQQGNMYGTTWSGGTSELGAVYELMPSGNGYTESVLYSFSGPDGTGPYSGLLADNKGHLFGTTSEGGSSNFGTVFELTYVVGVGWTEQVLYNFQNASDGAYPTGGLIFDSVGNLFGTTAYGGGGAGTVFELSPSGNNWAFKLLHSFIGQGFCGPNATLSMDGAGNLYGTTQCGGIYNDGSVFKLTSTQNGWAFSSMHDFTGGADGGLWVTSPVSIDTDGTLYGTTVYGGAPNCPQDNRGCGVVWMIKP